MGSQAGGQHGSTTLRYNSLARRSPSLWRNGHCRCEVRVDDAPGGFYLLQVPPGGCLYSVEEISVFNASGTRQLNHWCVETAIVNKGVHGVLRVWCCFNHCNVSLLLVYDYLGTHIRLVCLIAQKVVACD